MGSIEREIAQRKALLKEWSAEIDRLEASRGTAPEAERSKIALLIAKLGYKIHCGRFALKELEETLVEGRTPKPERPPLPKARRLGSAERQRIERETREQLKASLNIDGKDIQVHVGSITDERGNPQISIAVGRGGNYRKGASPGT